MSDLRTRPMTEDERRGYDHALDSLALWAKQMEKHLERGPAAAANGEALQRMRTARHLATALKHGTGGPVIYDSLPLCH